MKNTPTYVTIEDLIAQLSEYNPKARFYAISPDEKRDRHFGLAHVGSEDKMETKEVCLMFEPEGVE